MLNVEHNSVLKVRKGVTWLFLFGIKLVNEFIRLVLIVEFFIFMTVPAVVWNGLTGVEESRC